MKTLGDRFIRARAARLILVAAVLAVPHGSSAADVPIQPGAQVSTSSGLCTLNFVFREGGDRYVGTAGHCVEAIGERVVATGAGAFGTVVFRRDSGPDDFALILIDDDKLPLVSPVVRGIGLPLGYVRSTETATGDLVSLTGYGLGFSLLPETRTRRGVLAGDTDHEFFAEIPGIFGDSGAPLIHEPTGAALGIASGVDVTLPPSTLVGTTVERAMVLARAAGFNVSLATS
jgi:hypothetical protein